MFRRIERWTGDEGTDRGRDGPLSVTDMGAAMHPLTRARVAAAAEAGIPTNADYNGAVMEGAGFYQISAVGGGGRRRRRRICAARKN